MAMVSLNIAKLNKSGNDFWAVHIIFNVLHKNAENTIFLFYSFLGSDFHHIIGFLFLLAQNIAEISYSIHQKTAGSFLPAVCAFFQSTVASEGFVIFGSLS